MLMSNQRVSVHQRPLGRPFLSALVNPYLCYTLTFVTFSAFCFAASDKEANKKERDLEPPEASSSAKSSASKASGSRKLYDVANNATLEAVERMSLDLAEQIMEIDVERSYEFEKRSASKSRSLSRSKIPADSSTSQLGHVRKLTYSSERLDQPEPVGTQLRRSKSESLPKRGRPRGQKQRKNRGATMEEKVLIAGMGKESQSKENAEGLAKLFQRRRLKQQRLKIQLKA